MTFIVCSTLAQEFELILFRPLYVRGEDISVVNLFKIGLLFPLLMLAMRGLAALFPSENLQEWSLGRVAEFAILQGLVFAAFMVLFGGFMQPDLQSTFLSALRQFVIAAGVMGLWNFFSALQTQKKQRATKP